MAFPNLRNRALCEFADPRYFRQKKGGDSDPCRHEPRKGPLTAPHERCTEESAAVWENRDGRFDSMALIYRHFETPLTASSSVSWPAPFGTQLERVQKVPINQHTNNLRHFPRLPASQQVGGISWAKTRSLILAGPRENLEDCACRYPWLPWRSSAHREVRSPPKTSILSHCLQNNCSMPPSCLSRECPRGWAMHRPRSMC